MELLNVITRHCNFWSDSSKSLGGKKWAEKIEVVKGFTENL